MLLQVSFRHILINYIHIFTFIIIANRRNQVSVMNTHQEFHLRINLAIPMKQREINYIFKQLTIKGNLSLINFHYYEIILPHFETPWILTLMKKTVSLQQIECHFLDFLDRPFQILIFQ